MNVIGKTTEELYRIFDMLNEKYFNSELEHPVITIQKARANNLGHFTLGKVWKSNKDEESKMYEININSVNLNKPIEEIIGTLNHEMVHYANKVNDIKDCNGQKHNKKFKVTAEKCDLIVEKSEQYGWGHTKYNHELLNFINEVIRPDESAFEYFRQGKVQEEKPKKPREKKMFKYFCPNCGIEAKAKIDSNIMCGECRIEMEMEDTE